MKLLLLFSTLCLLSASSAKKPKPKPHKDTTVVNTGLNLSLKQQFFSDNAQIFSDFAMKQLAEAVEFEPFKEEYTMVDTFAEKEELKEKMTAVFYNGKITNINMDSTKSEIKVHAKEPTIEMRFFDINMRMEFTHSLFADEEYLID